MNWEERAACAGEWELFDRTDPVGIAEQVEMCHNCPVINECMKLAIETPRRAGTWGGRYFSVKSIHRGDRAIFDSQLLDATEDELKALHLDYYYGARDPITLAGERAYSRLQYRKRDKKEAATNPVDKPESAPKGERMEATPRRANAPRSIHSSGTSREGLDVKSTHTPTTPATESLVA